MLGSFFSISARGAVGWSLGFFLLALVAGWVVRFTDLDTRPMHTDEAVHGFKLEAMEREGFFDYDPSDYHGPVWHQVTSLWGRMQGLSSYDVVELRRVPAFFGWLSLVALGLFWRGMTRVGVVIAALLGAFSPMLVYFSRYYIMEVLLGFELVVFLGFLAAAAGRRVAWWHVLGMGVMAGLMHATKETFLLFVGPLLCAAWFCGVLGRGGGRVAWGKLAGGILAGVVVSAVFVTSFGRHGEDWGESYATYAFYLRRASQPGFEQPWYYYVSLLFWKRDGLVYSEAFTGVLGLVGGFVAWFSRKPIEGRSFFRALSLGLVVALGCLSVLSYKTPWTVLPFWMGWLILAGFGGGVIVARSGGWVWRSCCVGVLVVWLHFCYERNGLLEGRYASGPHNPYAFSHTVPDAVRLARRLRDTAERVGFSEFRVKVFHPEFGLPLGWYLRDLPMMGVWASPEEGDCGADVLVVASEWGVATRERLGKGWHQELFGLRAGRNLAVFISERVYDEWRAAGGGGERR